MRAPCRETERYPLREACEQARPAPLPLRMEKLPSRKGEGEEGWNRAKSASLAQNCAGALFLPPREKAGDAPAAGAAGKMGQI